MIKERNEREAANKIYRDKILGPVREQEAMIRAWKEQDRLNPPKTKEEEEAESERWLAEQQKGLDEEMEEFQAMLARMRARDRAKSKSKDNNVK